MKVIECKCGADIWLDDWNFEKVMDFNKFWWCNGGRVVTMTKGRACVSITWIIMGVERGKVVDHIDRNIHNNLESNLRPATDTQNKRNRDKYKNNTSGFKNVSFHKGVCKYVVAVRDGSGGKEHIGYYETAEKAAEYADMAMLRLHKEFAFLNFPHRKEEYVCRMEVKQRTGKEYLI